MALKNLIRQTTLTKDEKVLMKILKELISANVNHESSLVNDLKKSLIKNKSSRIKTDNQLPD